MAAVRAGVDRTFQVTVPLLQGYRREGRPEQITYDDDSNNIRSVRVVTAYPSIAFSVRT